MQYGSNVEGTKLTARAMDHIRYTRVLLPSSLCFALSLPAPPPPSSPFMSLLPTHTTLSLSLSHPHTHTHTHTYTYILLLPMPPPRPHHSVPPPPLSAPFPGSRPRYYGLPIGFSVGLTFVVIAFLNMALMWVQIASRTKKLKKSGSNLSHRFKVFVIAYSVGIACVNAVLVVLRIYVLSAMLVLLTMIMIAVRPCSRVRGPWVATLSTPRKQAVCVHRLPTEY